MYGWMDERKLREREKRDNKSNMIDIEYFIYICTISTCIIIFFLKKEKNMNFLFLLLRREIYKDSVSLSLSLSRSFSLSSLTNRTTYYLSTIERKKKREREKLKNNFEKTKTKWFLLISVCFWLFQLLNKSDYFWFVCLHLDKNKQACDYLLHHSRLIKTPTYLTSFVHSSSSSACLYLLLLFAYYSTK